jgi:hypothetical protein
MKSHALILLAFVMFTAACADQDIAASAAPAFGTGSDSTSISGRLTQAPSPAAAQLTAADLQDRMRKMGSAVASVQMLLADKNLKDVATKAQDIATWLGDVEKFWTQNHREDAVTWAQQARQIASQAAGAAAAGDAMKAQMAASTLANTCRTCHDAYREADGNGGFRIKPGVVH